MNRRKFVVPSAQRSRRPFWMVVALLATGCIGLFGIWLFSSGPATIITTPEGKTADLQPEPPVVDVVKGMAVPAKEAVASGGSVANAQISTALAASRTSQLSDLLDAEKVGWPTEAFSEAAKSQLKKLAKLLTHPEKVDAERLQTLVVDDFQCGPLRPGLTDEVFHDASIVVARKADAYSSAGEGYSGRSGLASALRHLIEPLKEAREIRVAVKVVGVSVQSGGKTTTSLFESTGTTDQGTIQQNATWTCQWQVADDSYPQLVAIQSKDYEQVEIKSPSETLFVDCTEAILAANPSYQQQLLFGLPHWINRIEISHGLGTFTRYGGAVGDVNGDGLDDLYICQPGGLPNRLFVQNKDGTAVDQSGRAGVDILDCSSSAIFTDLDNDGDQDLAVAIWTYLLLFENDGNAKFLLRDKLTTFQRSVRSLSATDYDNDGLVDLYITMDSMRRDSQVGEGGGRFIFHDANDGAANLLYRNRMTTAPWSFENVTQSVGLEENNRRHSLAAAWEDYDNDGDMDLYVANDFGQNSLYRNQDGHFEDVAPQVGVVDFGAGMSVSWADFDRDGWMDLYVGNMFSSAGNRITDQPEFKVGADQATRDLYRRFAKGNTLFRNGPDGQFQDVGARAAVEMGRWAWSSVFADINNDGWEDLLVANGYVTSEDDGDL